MPVRIMVVDVQAVAPSFPSLEWLAYLTTTFLFSHDRATAGAESFWNRLTTGTVELCN
jgi:hypothetical protein